MRGKLILQDFLEFIGYKFDAQKTMLVRHKDDECGINLDTIIGNEDKLEEYQQCQAKPVFHKVDNLVVFIGSGKGTESIFFGIYQVNKVVELKNDKMGCSPGNRYFYDLSLDENSKVYRWRIVIDWGKALPSWYQSYTHKKEILEIRPKGKFVKQFKDYDSVILTFSELKFIIENENANPDWFHALSNVKGVYVILDKRNQKFYIGSAYGENGIWGRWSEYVRTKHGGNVELQKLLEADPEAYLDFQFSILKVLPKGYSKKDVLTYEELYKQKLGSRIMGHNKN